jgi:uncharacterized membrane protein YdjX (TVP38/TMEM64 family)
MHSLSCKPCQSSDRPRRKCRPTDILGVVLICLLLVAGSICLSIPPVREEALRLLKWMEHHRTIGGVIYVVFFTLGVVICLPEIALAVAAGYVFNFGVAASMTWLGSVIGAVLAFLFGRHVFRSFLEQLCLQVGAVAIVPAVDDVVETRRPLVAVTAV